MQEKAHFWSAFSLALALALAIGLAGRLVILLTADVPVVRLEGLLAVGKVLLRHERCLVLGDFGQVVLALVHHLRYGLEAQADCPLVVRDRRAARRFLAEIKTVAVFAGGCRYAVGCQQHFLAAVLRVVTRFCQCAGYAIDTG